MHVATHLLAGWALAEGARLKRRERAVVAWSNVAPDLDGGGMLVDWANRLLGRPETAFYEAWHHALGHGLPAALVCLVAAYAITRRAGVALIAFASFHLHLLMDLAGSRGSNPIDIWPIPYLAPFSSAWTLSWSGQWPLTGWQNTTITVVLMSIAIALAVRRGDSPVALFSQRADAAFVAVLRARLGFLWRGGEKR